MRYNTVILCLIAVSNGSAFQFMSKFKMTPPEDLEKLEAAKRRFGDKSK